MLRTILSIFILVPLISGVVYYFMEIYKPPLPFESVCMKGNKRYTTLCRNVGKRAYGLSNMAAINNGKDFGPILGVSWRSKGSIISTKGQEARYSEKNTYYYIIGSDTSDYVYLRAVDKVQPK